LASYEEFRHRLDLHVAPAIVGAYLAGLAASHAPSAIRRRIAALGKIHRFNG
jgi:hypothetical protein